jgi:phage tail sheath protein FI
LLDNRLEEFGPAGAVAGVFARTDTQRGVWTAPAGMDANILGVSKLSVLLTDEKANELRSLGISCLRTFPAVGAVVWGSRTLEGSDQLADEWKYIPLRRTALFIEEGIFRGLKWVVFEPDDEPLWGRIRLSVCAFMRALFRQGAFQGRTAEEAYFESGRVRAHRDPADGRAGCGLRRGRRLCGRGGQRRGREARDGSVDHRERADPGTSRKSPGRNEYETITLERGLIPRHRV